MGREHQLACASHLQHKLGHLIAGKPDVEAQNTRVQLLVAQPAVGVQVKRLERQQQ